MLQPTPACAGGPTVSSTGNLSATSATAYWTDAPSTPSNGYNWIVVPTGTGVNGTIVASGTSSVGDDSTLITGLSASTTYDYYIQSNCGGTGVGTWEGPLTFTTPCGAITTFPYLQSFGASFPNCWSASAGSGAFYEWAPTTADANFGVAGPEAGTNFMYLYVYDASTAYNTYNLTSPPIALPSTPQQLSYYYFLGANGYQGTTGASGSDPYPMSVLISTNGGTSWTDIYDHSSSNSTFATNNSITNWHQNSIDLTPYANQTVLIRFASNSNFSFGTCDQGLDEFSIALPPACPGVATNVRLAAPSSTSGIAYWADASPLPSNGYNWEVVPTGAGAGATPVASGTANTGDDSTVISGLTAATTYDFFIQTNCGGTGTGSWAGPVTFTTPCNSIPLPLVEGFNSTSIPSCWSQQYVNLTSNLLFVSNSSFPTTTPEEGTDYVNWPSFYTTAPAGAETRLVTPPIITTGTPSVDVSFYWFNENSPSYNSGTYLNEGMTVQYSLDGLNWTDVQFFARQDNSLPSSTGQWKKKHLTLPLAVANQSTIFVGFKFHSSYGDDCSFDNLNIFPSPPCAGGPSSITANNITATGATVNWTAAPIVPANGYNWIVVLQGDSPTSIAPIATGSTAAGVDSFIISGLTPTTSYDIYVQSNCGGGLGLGYWEGPTTFTTPCSAITALPWTEGFEGLGNNVGSSILPACWLGTPSQYRWGSADLPFTYPVVQGAHTGTHFIYDYSDANDTLYTPGFALTGGVTYEFYYYYSTDGQQGWDSIKTMYGTQQNAGSMTNLIGNVIYGPTNTTYQKFQAQFTPATTGTYYFAVNLNASYLPYVMTFDDFGLKVAPPCAGLPSSLLANNLTPNTAQLNWAASSPAPAVGYNWELVAHGDSANGTVLFSGSTSASVDSAIATGLQSSTTYDLYVQSNCGSPNGVGDWSGPLTFTTPCSAITSLPWHDGFEGLGTNVGTDLLPQCWLPTPTQRWSTADAPFTFPTLNARTGNNFLYDYYNANDTVFTPGFVLTGGQQYEFYFYYLTDGNTGWDSIYAMYGNFQNQASMTTQIGPIVLGPTNTTYQKYSALFTPPTTGTYYMGVKLSSSYYPEDIAFDDFGIQAVVPCPNPPVTGTIGGPSTVCSGVTAQLTLTGYSPYTVLQWQSSSDSINFSDIVGANDDYINTIISSPSYFRVKVLCADSAYTQVFAVHLNSPINCYCNTLGGYCGFYNIDTVTILNTNFNVANAPCVYSNGNAYTQFPDTGSSTVTLQRGGTYSFAGFFENSVIASVWVDFDQSGTFDASEWSQIVSFGTNGVVTITIPDTAALGLTGMRVRSNYPFGGNGASDACTTFYDGETWDFHITIADTACLNVPVILDSVSTVSCNGGNNGSITLNVSGPFGPYTHVWSTGSNTAAISNLTAGRYTDTINFDYGCKYVWQTDTVAQPSPLTALTDSIHSVKCFGGNNGAIYISVSGGTPGYAHHWNSGEVVSPLTGKTIGSYTDTISDANGCRVVLGPDTITQPAAALAVAVDSIHQVKCYGQSNGAIYVASSGGTQPYSYIWSGTGSGTNLPAGVYTVSVTDINGCTASTTDSISQPAALAITTDSVVDAKCHTSSDGSIYVTVSGGTPNYAYAWTGGYTGFNLFLKPAGVYALVVTDANNCSASATDTITAPAQLSVASSITNQIQGGLLGSIATTVSGGVGPFKYHWNNGDSTSSLSSLTAGVYKVTVTDQNGCTTSQVDTVILIPTSIIEINGDVKDFNIYPNPSSGIINVLVELSHTVPVQLEVYTITGQQLHVAPQQTLSNVYQIDLSDQPSGVYLIKLTAGDYSLTRRITLVK